jgi:hypothetical protein
MTVDTTEAAKGDEDGKETDGMPARLDYSQPSRNCNNSGRMSEGSYVSLPGLCFTCRTAVVIIMMAASEAFGWTKLY